MSGLIINPYAYASAGGAVSEEYSESTGYNFGAETGDMTGWTSVSGTITATSSQANSGTYSFNVSGASEYYQDVGLDSAMNTAIDAGEVYLSVNAAVRHGTLNGSNGVTAYGLFYDGVGGSEVSAAPRTDHRASMTYNTWFTRGNGWQQLPSGTRCIRVTMKSNANSFVDDIVVKVKSMDHLSITSSMTNPTWETGTTSGWTGGSGVYQNSDFGSGKSGFEGTYFGGSTWFSASSGLKHYQDVTIPDTDDWYDSIDAGEVDVVVSSLYCRNGHSTIRAGMDLYTYDTGLTNLVTQTDHHIDAFLNSAPNDFIRVYGVPFTLGANKRIVRPYYFAGSGGGSTNYALYDDCTIDLYKPKSA